MSVYALIMAGGEGKRFWPLSSKSKPKQFLSLHGDKSLLVQTFDRINKIVPMDNIFVVTTKSYIEQTKSHLPKLRLENILAEPEGKNTGPCVYYGCKIISDLDEDAVVIVLPADHTIKKSKKFIDAINYSVKIANKIKINGKFPLITFGIKPSRPDSGYGYIEKSEELIDKSDDFESYRILSFKEKPDDDSVLTYFKNVNYYWNSGIFVWKIKSIFSEYSTTLPLWDRYSGFDFRDPGQLNNFYKSIDSAPVDKQILEKSENTIVIPVDLGWSDIGTWEALDDYQRSSSRENIIRGNVITEDTCNSFILSSTNRHIVTIGVENLVIVDSEDGLLIMDKSKSQHVKNVISRIKN